MNTPTPPRDSGFAILDQAHELLREAVKDLAGVDYDRSTPCEQWSVGQVIIHATLDQLHFAAAVTGAEKPEADPFQPHPADPASAVDEVHRALQHTAEAFSTLEPDAESVDVPLPPFTTTAQHAASAAALDAGIHAWDITQATGKHLHISDALATELLGAALLFVDPLREWGAYAPAHEIDEQAGPLHHLLAYTGRNPQTDVH